MKENKQQECMAEIVTILTLTVLDPYKTNIKNEHHNSSVHIGHIGGPQKFGQPSE